MTRLTCQQLLKFADYYCNHNYIPCQYHGEIVPLAPSHVQFLSRDSCPQIVSLPPALPSLDAALTSELSSRQDENASLTSALRAHVHVHGNVCAISAQHSLPTSCNITSILTYLYSLYYRHAGIHAGQPDQTHNVPQDGSTLPWVR